MINAAGLILGKKVHQRSYEVIVRVAKDFAHNCIWRFTLALPRAIITFVSHTTTVSWVEDFGDHFKTEFALQPRRSHTLRHPDPLRPRRVDAREIHRARRN